jgi:hypothetical protein
MEPELLFSYLDLPKLPENLIDPCLSTIEYIDNHPRLNELNKLEGISHNITFLHEDVRRWLKRSVFPILFKDISMFPEALRSKLHVSHYIKHPEGNGTHPIHFDYGRNYAINYIVTPGGTDAKTQWYTNDRKTKLLEVKIEPHRWHLIKVKPTPHGVTGIRPGQLRCLISLNIKTREIDESFDPLEHFSHVMIKD